MIRNSGFRLARSLAARGVPTATNLTAASATTTTASTLQSTWSTANANTILPNQQQQQSRFVSSMFCRQCEQTQDHKACTAEAGVCGKTAETSASQDGLLHVIKQVSQACVQARQPGSSVSPEVLQKANVWTLQAAFSTMTNVNFSEARIYDYAVEGQALLQELGADSSTYGLALPLTSVKGFELASAAVSVPNRAKDMGQEDCFSLNEIATYGLKGACAYAMHAHQLRKDIDPNSTLDEDIFVQVHKIFSKLASNEADLEGLLQTALDVGGLNGQVLAALDGSHAELLGVPEPTQVNMTATKGKCILVSGHDMVDLYHLLKQTEGTGINVYTHGEMLPAHSYPKLKQFKHLAGNYGTAWQNQNFEFASFPGPIIVTTNCIIKPRKIYNDRIYTMNEVGFDGVKHIGPDRDYSAVIQQAQEEAGFAQSIDPPTFQMVGFNHRAVLPLAGQIIEAAQSGALSRILLIGGCDGSQWDRNYFTDLGEESDPSTLILTLGCAKNRLIHSLKIKEQDQFTLPNGTVIPRVLDMGQCNDSYSAVVVATELAKALDCSVNDLPLSLALSHLEQKAAAVLLTLLNMGVQNIRLGPSLPAYVTPGVWKLLQESYNIKPTGNASEDLAQMMEGN